MQIGAFARQAGVTPSRIRFYEKAGLLPPPGRHENGYRSYSHEDVQLIVLVERAQRLGFSLREISGFLPHAGNGPLSCAAMLEHLGSKLVETDRLMVEVRRRRREIVGLMEQLRSGALHPEGTGEIPTATAATTKIA
jgi:MerR family copper efflux transcriptional regulator